MNDEDLRSQLLCRLRVGARVSVGRNIATVRYVGPIRGRNEEWVGFEWDDPGRGKHDGSHEGVRYFTCVYHPNAGSFVRLTKLLEAADSISLGCSLESAIYDKYKVSTQVQNADPEPTRVLVGEQEALDTAAMDGSLSQASFVGMNISMLVPTPPVVHFLRNVSVLDLSTNLISCWSSVLNLFGNSSSDGLRGVSTLILSDNRFTIAELGCVSLTQKLSSVQTLVLNSCGRLCWDSQVVTLGMYLPNLRALHLCNNKISQLAMSPQRKEEFLCLFSKLETLDLENNELADWHDIVEVCGDLPALKTLLLSDNRIESVHHIDKTSKNYFSSLRCLTLGSNNISSWDSVNALNTFAALKELRLSDNPKLDIPWKSHEHEKVNSDAEGIRYQIIARVSSLTVLNGSIISLAERHDAEVAYLGWIQRETPGEYITHHPRAEELKAKYGFEFISGATTNGGHLASVQTHGKALAASMVTLTFVSSNSTQLEKRVPTTLTIGRLRLLCERLLRIKIARDQPILLSPPHEIGLARNFEEITYHFNDRDLSFFGVESDGWSVYTVDHVDFQPDGLKPSNGQQALQHDLQHDLQQRLEAQENGWRRLREEERRLLLSSSDDRGDDRGASL